MIGLIFLLTISTTPPSASTAGEKFFAHVDRCLAFVAALPMKVGVSKRVVWPFTHFRDEAIRRVNAPSDFVRREALTNLVKIIPDPRATEFYDLYMNSLNPKEGRAQVAVRLRKEAPRWPGQIVIPPVTNGADRIETFAEAKEVADFILNNIGYLDDFDMISVNPREARQYYWMGDFDEAGEANWAADRLARAINLLEDFDRSNSTHLLRQVGVQWMVKMEPDGNSTQGQLAPFTLRQSEKFYATVSKLYMQSRSADSYFKFFEWVELGGQRYENVELSRWLLKLKVVSILYHGLAAGVPRMRIHEFLARMKLANNGRDAKAWDDVEKAF